MITRVDYDCATDRCVGFILPLDHNGLPIVDSFLAVSCKAIEEMFQSAIKAKYAYVYMAQSICLKAPTFCLAYIGSDSKFTAQHVLLRWKYIYEECTKKSMLVLSFGGNGDSPIMSATKQSVSLLCSKEPFMKDVPSSTSVPRIPVTWKVWLIYQRSTVSYVQDVVHVGVEGSSNRLFSCQWVHSLMQVEITCRWLEWSMVKMNTTLESVKDKQNFDTVLHIMNSCHLLKTIPEAKAT